MAKLAEMTKLRGHGCGRFCYFNQAGQTLIETMVAMFMLIMGVAAATGLAVYAFSTSNNIADQIVATGLAREGIEAVKNMRDNNWLVLTLQNTCYEFSSGTATGGKCYTDWLMPNNGANCNSTNIADGYCLDPNKNVANASGNFALTYGDPSLNQKIWDITIINGAPLKYGLDFNQNLASSPRFYNWAGNQDGTSRFYRKIIITKDPVAPFNQNEGPRLGVISQVWWTNGKKCIRVSDYPSAHPSCRIQLETKLTNWKDYQP